MPFSPSLYNTLTRRREAFAPLDDKNIRMYVCGPTVYDRPHLGNARSVVVYDVLYRLLRHVYGAERVTYVRNITDVDDKINARARERGISIQALTREVTAQFHADMDALGCLRPTHEPRATEYIAEMHALIRKLLENGHAYARDAHVLFDTASAPHYRPDQPGEGFSYGMLSHRVQEELVAGARVEVESYKKNPADFVLWKPAEAGDDPSSVFPSPWGPGRPGWHIECSAMSGALLGDTFDIHGGGADLMFPHHENEIAQSRCANPHSEFARVWVHNGFLTVNGEKMSKSLGNFVTAHDLLEDNSPDIIGNFLQTGAAEGKRFEHLKDNLQLTNLFPKHWSQSLTGQVIRLCLLSGHYRAPLDFAEKKLRDAVSTLERFYTCLRHSHEAHASEIIDEEFYNQFLLALCDDLNISSAFEILHQLTTLANKEGSTDKKGKLGNTLLVCGKLIGLFHESNGNYIHSSDVFGESSGFSGENEYIKTQILARNAAKKAKNWAEADRIRNELKSQGILLEDRPDGSTDWRRE